MKAQAIWIEGYRSVIDNGRGHSVVADLPKDLGGADTGATALELAVMALAGCVATIFKLIAGKRRLEFSSLRVEIEAEKPKDAKTVTGFKGLLEIETSASREEVEKTFKTTLENCPVGVIFENAGVKGEWEIKVKPMA